MTNDTSDLKLLRIQQLINQKKQSSKQGRLPFGCERSLNFTATLNTNIWRCVQYQRFFEEWHLTHEKPEKTFFHCLMQRRVMKFIVKRCVTQTQQGSSDELMAVSSLWIQWK